MLEVMVMKHLLHCQMEERLNYGTGNGVASIAGSSVSTGKWFPVRTRTIQRRYGVSLQTPHPANIDKERPMTEIWIFADTWI